METSDKRLYLTDIAKESGIDVKDIIHRLASERVFKNNVYVRIKKTDFRDDIFTEDGGGAYEMSGFDDPHSIYAEIPMHKDDLDYIYRNGSWTGSIIRMETSFQASLDENDREDSHVDHYFNKELTINIDDLFIYESTLMRIEEQNPELLSKKEALSQNDIDKQYVIIGIFLDLLVDRKEKILHHQREYLFKTQKELIHCIEGKYDLYGYKHSILEDIFGKANAALKRVITEQQSQ